VTITILMRASLRVGACFHRRCREGGAIDVPDGRAGEAMDQTTLLDSCHKDMTADVDMIYENLTSGPVKAGIFHGRMVLSDSTRRLQE
jgi:hypothetical protein